MSIYTVKPHFQAALRPVVVRLARAGATANQVTLAAAAGSLALGVVLAMAEARWLFGLLPLWLFARMALNAVDGMLAREFDQESRLGAYLNELGDVVSDAALYLPFALVAPFGAIWVAIVVVLAGVSELAGVLGQTVGGSRRYEGPLGKSDRALVFGALGLWIGIGGAMPGWTAHLMPLLALLLAITIIRRVQAGLVEAGRGY